MIKIFKKIVLVLIILVLFLNACEKKNDEIKVIEKETTIFQKQNNIDKTFNIAVIEYFDSDMDHNAYHGFFDYLNNNNVKYNIVYDYLAKGDYDDLWSYVEGLYLDEDRKDIDLFYCIGNEALSPVRSCFFNNAAIGTNLIRPEDYLVINNKNKIKFAAVRTMPPYERQLKLIERYRPLAKNIGILYTNLDKESSYQLELSKKYLEDNKYNVKTYEVTKDTDFNDFVSKIKNEIDVVYLPVDRFLLNNSKLLCEKLNKENIFIIGANHYYVDNGASITLAIDYYKAGEEAAKMAYEYLVEGYPIEKLLVRDLSLFSNSVYENKNLNN